MSNWAKLQEQITGLPVAKRARHGIHFKRPDGLIEASFVGKPCHYLDGAVWRAIDTKLIRLSDGWYGSPHSDVRIHPDGRVKAGGYQQYSELVGAKAGKVDGDRIVREFGFGVQYLYMKEDGFRQETVIERTPTTAEAKYLIATESGELPSKYRKSAITAVDADGDSHEFINLGQFKKWLEKAVYPVVIDPDFAGGTADGFIYGGDSSTDYATARNTSAGAGITGSSYKCGQNLASTYYTVYRDFVLFDTSSIGAGSTVTQANLKMTVETNSSTTDFVPCIAKFNWSAYAGFIGGNRETAYDGCLAADLDDGNFGSTGTGTWTANTQKTSGNLSTAWVVKDGTTYYGLISEEDKNNSAPTNSEIIEWYSANAATAGYRPVLTVTYTASGIAIPVAQYYYNRLRRN